MSEINPTETDTPKKGGTHFLIALLCISVRRFLMRNLDGGILNRY